ncbi:unnamed protein product [Protopolystoma xenopodis]|uniref:Uncharacterized protein n=1 Tax=Protopolystoma xenopodis TaxID=117903 RepID=A0A3S5A4Z4_9PLAT|nr:unnamed protein product [Protopolystoma xenopodis]
MTGVETTGTRHRKGTGKSLTSNAASTLSHLFGGGSVGGSNGGGGDVNERSRSRVAGGRSSVCSKTRKSVCHSVWAGLRNIRRSLASGGVVSAGAVTGPPFLGPAMRASSVGLPSVRADTVSLVGEGVACGGSRFIGRKLKSYQPCISTTLPQPGVETLTTRNDGRIIVGSPGAFDTSFELNHLRTCYKRSCPGINSSAAPLAEADVELETSGLTFFPPAPCRVRGFPFGSLSTQTSPSGGLGAATATRSSVHLSGTSNASLASACLISSASSSCLEHRTTSSASVAAAIAIEVILCFQV